MTFHNGFLTLPVALSLLASLSSPTIYADDAAPQEVTIAEGVGEWVLDPNSGRVFASIPAKNEVVELNSDGEEVRRIQVGELPTEMILKLNRLVIACRNSAALHIYDLQRNEISGIIPVKGSGPFGLFCSPVNNNYAYCICQTGDAWWEGEVLQVDLEKREVLKSIKNREWAKTHVQNVAMSRDGKWLVLDGRGESFPSGAELVKVDEDAFTLTPLQRHHESFGPLSADPFNRYWTFGEYLYSLDTKEQLRKFAGSPAAIHPQFDVVVSRTKDGLALERFSDASPIVTIPLQADAAVKTSGKAGAAFSKLKKYLAEPSVHLDLRNNKVFVGSVLQGRWISLEKYLDRFQPMQMITAPSEAEIVVGQLLRIPLEVTNAQASDQDGSKNASPSMATLRLASGPKSAAIVQGHLEWLPSAAEVGPAPVRLELIAADKSLLDSVDIQLRATVPTINLEFFATKMELSEGGRYLATWGPSPGQEDRPLTQTGSDDLAVVDLESLTVLARSTVPRGIRCATIDAEYVYISPNSGNLFYRLDHSLKNSKRQFLTSAPQQLIKLAPDLLATIGDNVQLFKTIDLEPHSAEYLASNVNRCERNVIQTGSRIFDRQSGKTLRITGPGGLPSLMEIDQSHKSLFDAQYSSQWGRRIDRTSLNNHRGSPITSWNGDRGVFLSERWPFGLTVSVTEDDDKLVTTTLEILSLIDGSARHTAIIDLSPSLSPYNPREQLENRLILNDDQLLYIKDKNLLVTEIPQEIAAAMPVPNHFLLEQITEIELSDSAVVPLAVGGTGNKVTFDLWSEPPGMTLNRETGDITVELQKLWDKMAEKLVSDEVASMLSDRNRSLLYENARDMQAIAEKTADGDRSAAVPLLLEKLVENEVNAMLSSAESTLVPENAKRYQALVGRELPAGRFAAVLPLSVVLRDAEGQEDILSIGVVVIGPRAAIEAAIRTQYAERRKEYELDRVKRSAKQLEMRKAPSNSTDAQRIERLEAKVRLLEAAIETILKRLDAKH